MKPPALDDETLAQMMRALGHPARLEILRILVERSGQCCCTEITGCLALAQSTVSQHLKVLLDAEVIERQPVGTRNRYRVRADRLEAFSAGVARFCVGLRQPQPA